MSNYVIATCKEWNEWILSELQNCFTDDSFYLITNKDDLNHDQLIKINPTYVFIPHWSYIIKPDVYKNFECIIFHMTDLPYGRGGSPLQNLIVRNHENTKISAIKCIDELDAGNVYLKKDLSLNGSAQEIFQRSSSIICDMIKEIILTKPTPQKQIGEIVKFNRRKPEDGDIANLDNINKIYDYIRMLDADTYPKAFLMKNNIKLEFYNALQQDDHIECNVKLYVNKKS